MNTFQKLYDDTPTTIPFQPEWDDHSSTLTKLAHERDLVPFGAVAKTISCNRKVVIIGLGLAGSIVLYQRYADNPDYWIASYPNTITDAYWADVGDPKPFTSEALEMIATGILDMANKRRHISEWFTVPMPVKSTTQVVEQQQRQQVRNTQLRALQNNYRVARHTQSRIQQ